MSEVLYRKYRPKDFNSVVGHDNLKKILTNELKGKSLPHALLFSGQKGTGKTSIARLIAKIYNCQNNENNKDIACNECDSCVNFNNDSHPDIIEIDAASNNGVDEIRGLKQNINVSPIIGKYRIYIIDEVHMLTQSAFNAFLKTLEEPPSFVIFILATTEIHKIPQTILSRCQLYNLSKLSLIDIKTKIIYVCEKENRVIDEDCIDEIYYMSDGSLRDALNTLDQLFAYVSGTITIEVFKNIYNTISKKEKIQIILSILLKKYDDLFLIFDKIDNENINLNIFILSMIDILKELIEKKIIKKNQSLIYIATDDLAKFNTFEVWDIIGVADIFVKLYETNKINRLSSKIILLNIIKHITPISNKENSYIFDNSATETKKEAALDEKEVIKDVITKSGDSKAKFEGNLDPNDEPYNNVSDDDSFEDDSISVKKKNIVRIKEEAIFICLSKSSKEYREYYTSKLKKIDFSISNHLKFLQNSVIIAAMENCILYTKEKGAEEDYMDYDDFINNNDTIEEIKKLFGTKMAIIQIERNKLQLYKIKLEVNKDMYSSKIFSIDDFYSGIYFDIEKPHDEKLEKVLTIFGEDKVKIN